MKRDDISSVLHRKKRRNHLLLLFFLLIVAGVLFAEYMIHPIVETLAMRRAETLSTSAMNSAVEKCLRDQNIDYASLVHITYDADGVVTSIAINSVDANRLKAMLSSAIAESIDRLDRNQVSIPIGTLTGIDFLAGRGPKIKFYISLSGSSSANIVSKFESAGINQVCHRINLEVTANIYIILPGRNISTQVKNDINLAETVIVGEIPQIYAGAEDEIWPNLID